MRFVVVLISVLLSVGFARANQALSRLDEANRNFSRDMEISERAIKAAEEKVKTAERNIASAQRQGVRTEWFDGVPRQIGTSVDSARQAHAEAQASLARLKDQRKELQGAMDQVIADTDRTLRESDQAQRAAAETQVKEARELERLALARAKEQGQFNRNIIKIFQGQSLLSKYEDLRKNFYDQNSALDRISREYDSSLLGAYIKDKLGFMLNSPAMCDVQKQCAAGAKSAVIKGTELNNIFKGPDSAKSTRLNYQKTGNQ